MDPKTVLSRINEIERAIIDSDFTNEQIQYPLLYVTIAKGSLQYCMDRTNNPEKYKRPSKITPTMANLIWKADAKGAIIGTGLEGVVLLVVGHFATIAIAGHAVVTSVEKTIKESKKRKIK